MPTWLENHELLLYIIIFFIFTCPWLCLSMCLSLCVFQGRPPVLIFRPVVSGRVREGGSGAGLRRGGERWAEHDRQLFQWPCVLQLGGEHSPEGRLVFFFFCWVCSPPHSPSARCAPRSSPSTRPSAGRVSAAVTATCLWMRCPCSATPATCCRIRTLRRFFFWQLPANCFKMSWFQDNEVIMGETS